jgi:type I phosphodiesterase/nucleotide pyrophosphatase
MRTVAFVVVAGLAGSCVAKQVAELALDSSDQKLRERPRGARESSPDAPPLLVLALDGVSRDLLYEELRAGELPHLATLLGGDHLAHAYLDESLLSTLPSTTMAAWVSALTGVGPADHGVTGNEYFIRERRELACPAPISFSDPEPTLAIYTDRYLDHLVDAPTVYERMRAREPDILIWVTMNHLFRGADRMLMAKRTAIVKAFSGLVATALGATRELYETLDRAGVDVLVEHLKQGPVPDVLMLYMSGTDLYAHVAEEGPDRARRTYLHDVVDPQLGRVVERLRERGVLDRLWVVTLADHGHTEVVHDDVHALGSGGDDARPVRVLRDAGFRVRAFKQHVDVRDPFSAVIAYGGAMAYVYLADRSQCPGDHDPCPWQQPTRYTEDVLPVAEAYFRANRDGAMRDTLDLVLVRRPRPVADIDRPFEVYLGDGKTQPVAAYLAAHPHPTYVAFAERLHDLAVGVHGERAGDVLLVARDGDVDRPDDRYYFASPYHSWHGSASRADSEVPLIVANSHRSAAQIGRWVRRVLGSRPYLQRVADILIGLREGALGD